MTLMNENAKSAIAYMELNLQTSTAHGLSADQMWEDLYKNLVETQEENKYFLKENSNILLKRKDIINRIHFKIEYDFNEKLSLTNPQSFGYGEIRKSLEKLMGNLHEDTRNAITTGNLQLKVEN
ncbi:MAG: hypothetical protein KC516_04085 [Nanoarchaeota archaeon]|nr:hypothetical protein [Nanoarchaeota archaeon]